jgi:hypothetical protein
MRDAAAPGRTTAPPRTGPPRSPIRVIRQTGELRSHDRGAGGFRIQIGNQKPGSLQPERRFDRPAALTPGCCLPDAATVSLDASLQVRFRTRPDFCSAGRTQQSGGRHESAGSRPIRSSRGAAFELSLAQAIRASRRPALIGVAGATSTRSPPGYSEGRPQVCGPGHAASSGRRRPRTARIRVTCHTSLVSSGREKSRG